MFLCVLQYAPMIMQKASRTTNCSRDCPRRLQLGKLTLSINACILSSMYLLISFRISQKDECNKHRSNNIYQIKVSDFTPSRVSYMYCSIVLYELRSKQGVLLD